MATDRPPPHDRPVPAARVVFSDADITEITELVAASLRSGSLTLGANTEAFETAFSGLHGGLNAVAVSSGTAALEIVLRTLEVTGREVIVPTNTFAATAFAVLAAGATPVFADIEPTTMSLSIDSIQAAMTRDTAAVVLVHIGGLITPEVHAIARWCAEHDVAFVEDAAHAHGATFQGRHAGSFGAAGTFSFYPTKVVTSAEGGMVVTADDRIAAEARMYRDQGKAGFAANNHVRLGYAWRISEPHAAIGLVHLRHLEESLTVRHRVAQRYVAALSQASGIDPVLPHPESRSSWYKFVALLHPDIDRLAFKSQLRTEFNVCLSGEVYETPLHRQPALARYAQGRQFPAADAFCAQHVCLPIHSDMRDTEIEQVTTAVRLSLGTG